MLLPSACQGTSFFDNLCLDCADVSEKRFLYRICFLLKVYSQAHILMFIHWQCTCCLMRVAARVVGIRKDNVLLQQDRTFRPPATTGGRNAFT